MNILGLIPARGGSKEIPGKNTVLLGGKPLLAYTVEAAKNATSISRVVLSTDSEEIALSAKLMGIDVPFMRPSELAQDDTPMIDVIIHTLDMLDEAYDAVVLLQPTSPLRAALHIDEAVKIFESSEADTVVSVMEVPHQFSPESLMKIEQGVLVPFSKGGQKLRRQEKVTMYARNGPAILIVKSISLRTKGLYGGNVYPYRMNPEHSVDIDSVSDLAYAECLLKNNQKI